MLYQRWNVIDKTPAPKLAIIHFGNS